MTSQAVLDAPPQSVRAFPAGIDPVRFEVLRNALLAITEEMGATLRRAAYSTNIKTRGDFSCAFFDRELRTIAQAFAQPSHLGSLALGFVAIAGESLANLLEPWPLKIVLDDVLRSKSSNAWTLRVVHTFLGYDKMALLKLDYLTALLA